MAVDEAGRRQRGRGRRSGGSRHRPPRPARRPRPSGRADPSPTATIRSSSITRCPSRYSVPAASTVAIAQPSMTVRIVTSAAPRRCARRPAGRRRGSSRSPCTGTGCPPAPRGSRGRSGRGLRRSRSWLATISPGVQNPHCTPPASTNARCTSCRPAPSPLAIPSTVTTSRPCACAASTRQEHTSFAVEVDRARSALALLACVLRSGEAEMLAQRVEQALPLPHAVHLPALAVDGQRQAHRYASQAQVSVRRASTPSA